MKQTKPKQSPPRMEVINKPKVAYTKKSLEFFFRDKRKLISAILVISIPIIQNSWRFFPEDLYVPIYSSIDIFVWTFSVNFIIVVVGVAWTLCVPRKDHVLQYLSLSVVAYGIYLTLDTIPFATSTSLWTDILATAAVFFCFYFCLRYIQKNYLERPDDYKQLHDGLVYDIHHQRFLSSIDRVAGLIDVAEMEEPYKCLCAKEIEELKESIAYIAEKYEALK